MMQAGILPSRKELLSRIELVCDLDISFIAVTGDAGIGKSALLEFFIEHHCVTRKKCFIQAVLDQPAHALFEQILVQLTPGCIYDSRLSLGQNIRSVQRHEPLDVIIIIDNAQHIDNEVFVQLIQLLKSCDEHYQFSVIFAQPHKEERFNQLNSRHPLIEIHIEPLSQAESKMLLEFYYSSMIEGDRQEVVQFIERSQGNPAKLLKWEEKKGGTTSTANAKTLKNILLIVLVLIIVSGAGIAGWLFIPTEQAQQTDIVELPKEQVAVLDQKPQLSNNDAIDAVIDGGEQADVGDTVVDAQRAKGEADLDNLLVKKWDSNTPKLIVEESLNDVEDKTQVLSEANEGQVEVVESESELKSVNANKADAIVEQINTKTAETFTDNTDEPTAIETLEQDQSPSIKKESLVEQVNLEKTKAQTSDPLVVASGQGSSVVETASQSQEVKQDSQMDNQWFMSKLGSRYVIQLTGVSDPAILETYLVEHQLKGRAHIYQSMRGGKPWFVVTTGDHENAAAARTAINALAVSLLSSEPWIKSISTIQSEINNAKKTKQ